MKYIISYIAIICVCLCSCKKKYTCECSTLNTSSSGGGTYINQETYHVKEKSKLDAQTNCAIMYEASGKATNGINCDIK